MSTELPKFVPFPCDWSTEAVEAALAEFKGVTIIDSVWQPIETAPKDGTPILIWDGFIMATAKWSSLNGWAAHGASGWVFENDFHDPTHWMPLPEPPQ